MPQQWKSVETDEEFRNEIIEKNTPKNYFLVNFSRFFEFSGG